ncbi:hypothetical protein HYH03_018080 [Edaphochlamys debaryana]|uniref:EF-hand domain-containing protein n=1 Tax=Edaphochlamys debaryana TaxID=47281 RepID=A0A835XIR2_9CHLO|nr:hypothetical protein HYH03_018080 [Edaphochlamys debaryana]|eukprot:KAG2483051.1 hypothetical protein HYH03_018080 [Edaphochlamys debaryana]
MSDDDFAGLEEAIGDDDGEPSVDFGDDDIEEPMPKPGGKAKAEASDGSLGLSLDGEPVTSKPKPKAEKSNGSLGLSLSGGVSGTKGTKPASKPASKPGSTRASLPAEDSLGLSLSGEPSGLGPAKSAASKPPSIPASKPSSKPPSIPAEDSLNLSLSGEPSGPVASRQTSKPGSVSGASRPTSAAPASSLPPRPSPRGSDLGSGGGATPSVRPPASTGRAPSLAASASYHSEDYDHLLSDGGGARSAAARSAGASLPRPGSAGGSGAATPTARPTSQPSYTPASYTPASSMARTSGMLGTGLAPPEPSHSPAASRRGSAAGAGPGPRASLAGGARHLAPVGNSSAKTRRLEISCPIPTPFELFRLYDNDCNGCVTHNEFVCMMRDLDSLPLHYNPAEDPEARLVELKEKKARLTAVLERREGLLNSASQQPQTPPEALAQLQAEVGKLRADALALEEALKGAHAEARALEASADEAERVTPEVRQKRKEWRTWVEAEFKRADVGANNILSIDEFYMYYYSKLCFRFPVLRTGMNPGAALFNIFVKYCSFGRGEVGGRNEDMLSHQFYKLVRDAGLINGKTLAKASVDIIYHRSRAADEMLETYTYKAGVAATSRMYYPQFLFGLDKIAEKRRSGFQEVVAKVLSTLDTLPEASFSDFMIMSGHELDAGQKVPEYLLRPRPLPSNARALRSGADNDLIRKMKEESAEALSLSTGMLTASQTAAGGGAGGLASFLSKQQNGKGEPPAPASAVSQGDTGAYSADFDKSGAATPAGAPGPAGAGALGGSGELRKSVYPATMRPVGIDPAALRKKEWEKPEPPALAQSVRGSRALHNPSTLMVVRGLDPDALMVGLKRCFEAYAAWGSGVDRGALDKPRFGKCLRDAGLVAEAGALPARKVDAVYHRVLPASSRALNFVQFIEALRHVAVTHRIALNEVMEKLVAVGAPQPGP